MIKRTKPSLSINIPTKLAEEIELLVKDELCLHTTKGGFVTAAVTRYIEYVREEIRKERVHRDHLETLGIK